jgi:hypothetical protein
MKGYNCMKDYFGFKDKVCIVTGGASGMGKSAAEMLIDVASCGLWLQFSNACWY